MSHFVRASKYRHVYVDPPKVGQTWTGVPLSTSQGEQSYIKANCKYFAIAVQGGGGPFVVMPFDKAGRYDRSQPVFSGHRSPVLDFDFHPFVDSLVASASDDSTIKLWGIPEGGLKETQNEAVATMNGHRKKVTLLRFHPTAENCLASVSADMTVRLWDISTAQQLNCLEEHSQLIQDIVWDYTGTTYATSCKDKSVRICDARSAAVVSTIPMAHEGARSAKLTFLGSKNKLLSVGFTKQSQRHFKIWDPRNLSKEIKNVPIDQASGVILPFYDEDSCLLYLAGKGDGNVRYYECVDETPWCFAVSEYRTITPAKGMAMVPKRGLNISKCETARLLKVTSSAVEPLSFTVPRKSDAFQDDLFPPTFSGEPSHTMAEWVAGSNKEPKKVSLDPADSRAQARIKSVRKDEFQPVKSPTQLKEELEAALARISLLEAALTKGGLPVPP